MTSLWRHFGSHAIGSEFDSSKCYFFSPYLFVYLFYLFHFFFIFTVMMIMVTVLLIKT